MPDSAAVEIEGTPRVGETLIAILDGIGAEDAFFQWKRAAPGTMGFSVIWGAEGETFVPRNMDAGWMVKVIVGHRDHSTLIESEAVGPVGAPVVAPESISVVPNPTFAVRGGRRQLAVTVQPELASSDVIWSIVQPAGIATITERGGLLEILDAAEIGDIVTVMATSAGAPGVTDVAHVTVTAMPERVTLLPRLTAVAQGGRRQFEAIVEGPPGINRGVVWTVTPQGAGTISQGGLLEIHGTTPDGAQVTVTATADTTSVSAYALVTVTAAPTSVMLAPLFTSMAPGESRQFNAGVMPPMASQRIVWTIVPADAGDISETGLFALSGSIGIGAEVTVVATADTSDTYAEATVLVVEPSDGGGFDIDFSGFLDGDNEPGITIPGPTIPVMAPSPAETILTVADYGRFDEIRWIFNGNDITPAPTHTLHFDESHHGRRIGSHFVTVEVRVGERWYAVIVIVAVVL